MNKMIGIVGLGMLSTAAFAADMVDTAVVVSSTPIYERITEPRQDCWTETVQVRPGSRDLGGAVVGGVAGGLAGNQMGYGEGKTAATAAGAVIGTMVGDRNDNPDSNHSTAGAIIGGVAGAVLGSQVGGGSGRQAATAAGAMVGAIVGDRMGSGADQPRTQTVQRCREVQVSRDVIRGYTVVYRYKGKEATTTLSQRLEPGSTVQVGVSLIAEEPQVVPPPSYSDRYKDRHYAPMPSPRYPHHRD